MRRLTLPLLIVLLLGATGFGVVQFDELKKMRLSLSELDREREALRKRVGELQKLNGDLAARNRRNSTAFAPAGTAETVAADAGSGGEALPPPTLRPAAGRMMNAFNNPEVQRLMALQQKAALDGRYAALFRSLNLNPADLERFKDLLVERQTAVMDVMAAARSEGLDPRTNREGIRQLVQDTQAELEESIRSALGDAGYAQYKNYEATLPQRGLVDQLGQRLSYSSTPLTDAQAEQLVNILASTSPVPNSENQTGLFMPAIGIGGRGGPAPTFFGAGGTRITDEAVAQAQGVLSPQQLAALQSLQQEQQASNQLMQQMRTNITPRSDGATGATVVPAVPLPAPGGG